MKTFQPLNLEETKSLIDTTEARELIIVDIRDPQSYQEAHIDNAINVNQENVQDFIKSVDKHKHLICYCYHGISSQSAADYFYHQGFHKTYSIEGGFEAWRTVYPSVSS